MSVARFRPPERSRSTTYLQASSRAIMNLLLFGRTLHIWVEAQGVTHLMSEPEESAGFSPDLACTDPQQRFPSRPDLAALLCTHPCKRGSVRSNRPARAQDLDRGSKAHYTMSQTKSSTPLPLVTVPDRTDPLHMAGLCNCPKTDHQTSRERSSGCGPLAQVSRPCRRLALNSFAPCAA